MTDEKSNFSLKNWIKGNWIKVVDNIFWIVIGIIIVASLGKYLLSKAPENDVVYKKPVVETDWSKIDSEISHAIQEAENNAKLYAIDEIDQWNFTLKTKIDPDFLDWYFGYWTQTMMGVKGLGNEIIHWASKNIEILPEAPTAVEEMTQEIQEKFSSLVLRPQIAHKQISKIAEKSINIYASTLNKHLNIIPEKYGISKQEWIVYLESLALTTKAVGSCVSEDDREVLC